MNRGDNELKHKVIVATLAQESSTLETDDTRQPHLNTQAFSLELSIEL